MSNDAINSWIEKAKQNAEGGALPAEEMSGVKVIKRTQAQSRGSAIMDIAEKIRPWLTKMFEGVRDEEGLLVQPAHVRGIALNVAQNIVKEQQKKAS
jgi:hypothetical protein